MEPPLAVAVPAQSRVLASAGRLRDLRTWSGLGLVALAVGSAVGWVLAVSALDPRLMTDLGLISVLPPVTFVFIALLCAAFALALSMRRPITAVLLTIVVVFVVMIYGAPALLEDMPRFATAWLHVGFADTIARTGELYPLRDARFDWPGFFTLFAFLSSATAYEDLVPILAWVPPIIMLLYLGPLYLIFRAADADERLTWLAIWLFYLVNWVGQDYFSPQAFNFLLFLASIAIILTWFHREPGAPLLGRRIGEKARAWLPTRLTSIGIDHLGRWRGPGGERFTRRQQVGLVAIVVLLFGASVASHQLTPFALLGGVIGLTVFRRTQLTGLSVVMIVMASAWLLFMTTTYLSGHLADLLADIGRAGEIADRNIGSRLSGSPGHLQVVQVRLGLTIGVWALALIGGVRRLISGHLDLTMALLAVAPFGLMLLQAYGGEMLLRVYLFSSPFMAFFAAAAFIPTAKALTWRTTNALAIASVVLASLLLLARYGNEKVDYITPEEYEVIAFVTAAAQPGDMIGAPNHAIPLEYREWEQHRVIHYGNRWFQGDITGMLANMNARTPEENNVFFVITRGQRAYTEVFGPMSARDWDLRVRSATRHGQVVFANADGAVYLLDRPTGAAP